MLAWGCGACLACAQPPDAQFARQLERASSWASAVEFAAVPPAADASPRAYTRDLDRRAAEDLARIAKSLRSLDVDPGRRERAVAACTRFADLLRNDLDAAPSRPATHAAADEVRRAAAAARAAQ